MSTTATLELPKEHIVKANTLENRFWQGRFPNKIAQESSSLFFYSLQYFANLTPDIVGSC